MCSTNGSSPFSEGSSPSSPALQSEIYTKGIWCSGSAHVALNHKVLDRHQGSSPFHKEDVMVKNNKLIGYVFVDESSDWEIHESLDKLKEKFKLEPKSLIEVWEHKETKQLRDFE